MSYRKQTKKWTTKDKRKIRICDMENPHLINTIKLIQRACESKRIHDTVFYVTCPTPQGDMAQLAFDQEFDMILEREWQDYAPTIYSNLVDDALRRGLDIPEQPKRFDIVANLIGERLY